jgi:hypothetical protein
MTRPPASDVHAVRAGVRGARRAAIIAIIVSLSIAALVGIVVLLTGANNEVLSKILGTTLVLAAFSVTSLCHLAVVGKAPQIVGFVGIVASGCAFAVADILLWSNGTLSNEWSQNLYRTLWVLTVLALSLAHANLMLLLEPRKHRGVRIGLRVTLALIALVAIGIWIPILDNGTFPGSHDEWYWRLFGVLAILDVLGTIVLPVTGVILKDTPRRAEHQLSLPAELANQLDAVAAKQNTTRDAVALDILKRGVGG